MPLVFYFPSCILFELFCFDLILRCRGFNIMGLDGRNMKEMCALLHFVKPVLLHLG